MMEMSDLAYVFLMIIPAGMAGGFIASLIILLGFKLEMRKQERKIHNEHDRRTEK